LDNRNGLDNCLGKRFLISAALDGREEGLTLIVGVVIKSSLDGCNDSTNRCSPLVFCD
jgi:hypothetical protein